jgi:hypothetical protein
MEIDPNNVIAGFTISLTIFTAILAYHTSCLADETTLLRKIQSEPNVFVKAEFVTTSDCLFIVNAGNGYAFNILVARKEGGKSIDTKCAHLAPGQSYRIGQLHTVDRVISGIDVEITYENSSKEKITRTQNLSPDYLDSLPSYMKS